MEMSGRGIEKLLIMRRLLCPRSLLSKVVPHAAEVGMALKEMLIRPESVFGKWLPCESQSQRPEAGGHPSQRLREEGV